MHVTTYAAMQDCQRRIVEGWLSRLPEDDWTVSYLFWGPGGSAIYSQSVAIDLAGDMHSISLPNEVHEALRELRDLMSDPQRGAWISVDIRLTDERVLEADFNWDKRFYWGTHPGNPWAPDPDPAAPLVPSDDDFRDELAAYPRELMFLPAWYPRPRAEHAPAADDRFANARDAAVSLPDEVKPLADAWGWPAVFTTITEAVMGNAERRTGEAAAALLGDAGEHAHDDALDALVDDAVASTLLMIDRSPALAAVRMLEAWLELRSEQPPVDLEPADVSDVLSDLVREPGPRGRAARAVRSRLESIVRLVVEDQVDDRFGG